MALFKPFGSKAQQFIKRPVSRDKKYTLLEGSVRSSKTFAVDAKLISQLCLYPVAGKRIICGATKQTVYKNILLDIFTVVGKKNYAYNRANGELYLFGTLWFVIGAKDEASYKQILGMTVGIAICDEWSEFPRSFTMQLFLRMSPPGARLYATTNPGTPQHYLFTEVINDPKFQEDLEVIHFTLEDNPNIDPKSKRQIIASQKGVYYQRYILGLWVVAEGAIYKDSWNDSWLYDDTTVPIGLYGQGGFIKHVIGIDYGTTNPCTFLEYIDDGEVVWLDREYYWDSVKEMRQKTNGEYADDLEQFILGSRVSMRRPPIIVVDPKATSFKVELARRGYVVIDGDNEVLDGIHKVSMVEATGHRRVHRDCKEWRREHGLYAWDSDAALDTGEERPIKQNDHTQDGDRYALMNLFPEWRELEPIEPGQLLIPEEV
jgi:PBSX family phage terminase large subunit